MSEIRFIVDSLCAAPFNKSLTLVTFDELGPYDLLNLTNEVFGHLDPRHKKVDLRDENQDQLAARFLEFLKILKYNPPPNIKDFPTALVKGQRGAVYHVLHWVLNRLESLQKRAYLARFLVSVEIPPAYLHDESVQQVYQQYKALQHEFKSNHKALEKLRQSTLAPGELKKEIVQLEKEQQQLKEKTGDLQRTTEHMPGFHELFKVTSALRREQEEEGKLQDRRREQRQALANAEARCSQVGEKLEQMREAHSGNAPPGELLDQLRSEVKSNRETLQRGIRSEIQSAKLRLQEIQQSLREPVKSVADVEGKQVELARAQEQLKTMSRELASAQQQSGVGGSDDKLKRYRQQSSIVTKKLREKEQELEDVLERGTALKDKVKRQEEVVAELAGPKYMRGEEFKQYANTLRSKTAHYKQLKKELASIRAESVVLSRTEAILKARVPDLDTFLQSYQARQAAAGEIGGNNTQGASDDDNDMAGRSVEEISQMLSIAKDELKTKKTKLAPQIKELRKVREHFQTLEVEHTEKKVIYENTAVGLESEKIKLEQECEAAQEEALRGESRYHYLHALSNINDVQLQRVEEELEYQQGVRRLRRDFKSYQDLFTSKVQRQEQLSKELRKKQKSLKEVEGANTQQRQMFVDLKRLLAVKLQVAETQRDQLPLGHEDGVFDMGQDIMGANVMTIEQGA
jgi:intraflagellar transport protein 81